MTSACFLSDLHLLSPRSMAPQWMHSIDSACRESKVIVLGGDIFDFRWATLGGHVATLVAAKNWLSSLLDRHREARVVYILGNHDSHPDMQDLLDDLATTSGRLEWTADCYRLGDCLFCHGDVLDAGSWQQLADYRRRFQHERQASRAAHNAYEVAVAMRLHRALPALFHRPRATCTRLTELLNVASRSEYAGVQRIFFGHTHVPIYELPLGPFHFYNPGAALRHLNFAPITFEVDGV